MFSYKSRRFFSILFNTSPEVPGSLKTSKRTMLSAINNALDIAMEKDSS
jgi:hypothetical protein